MALQLRQSRQNRVRELISNLLDIAYAPVISRLTNDEYFSCRTRNDCVRALLRRMTHIVVR